MRYPSLLASLLLLLLVGPAAAQSLQPASQSGNGLFAQAPRPVELLGLSVEGVAEESMRAFVLQSSGLTVGQQITLPGDQAIAEAIRSIYKLRVFSDVKIVEERRAGEGVFLSIQVTEEPQLADYTFTGIKKKHRKDLQKEIPLFKGSRVRPADLERSKQAIKSYFYEKGHMLADVTVQREVTPENALKLEFVVDQGPKVEVEDIRVRGNQEISSGKLRKQMDETKEDRWWKFWSSATFDKSDYETDKDLIVQYYRDKGFYDARIVRDSVYLDTSGDEPGVIVEVEVHEGPRYHIRNVEWEGNTIYSDEVLSQALGFEEGDVYNESRLEENLYSNRNNSDVSSLYMNRGYMLFRVQPEVRVEGDSLDLVFDMSEGDVFQFGEVTIQGNSKTKEHVIRRELYTMPGETFSRDSIQESMRRLSQLNYFDQESLAAGPNVAVDQEDKEVDLTYSFTEVGSDQLELSGTYGQFGLVLQLRFGFNNFAIGDAFNKGAWRPLPSGDGQQLSLSLQTNGTQYQSYSVSFTEPWFRGKPTPIGFSLAFSRFSDNVFSGGFGQSTESDGKFISASARVFHQRRLKWPDDKFTYSTSLGYQFYNNVGRIASALPEGISNEVTVRQGISRSSLNHPIFPTEGSSVSLSVEVAPPVGDFIQYHKWRFDTGWNVPLSRKLTLGVSTNYGYIGSLTGDDVLFQRFVVGGSPFDAQGNRGDNFGKDLIYGRGYPARVIGPRRNGSAVGGRILNKYVSELRWLAVQSPQLQAAPYLFMEASNTWDNFNTYNPTQLFRSAGLGTRLFLPILGMLELSYGYNFDTFEPISSGHNGSKRWLFQFSIGQGFGQ